MEGLIVRSLGGFYTVISEDGTKTECRGRGIFRRDATTLLVGDRCRFEPTEPGCGSITAIEPRKIPCSARRWPTWTGWRW